MKNPTVKIVKYKNLKKLSYNYKVIIYLYNLCKQQFKNMNKNFKI